MERRQGKQAERMSKQIEPNKELNVCQKYGHRYKKLLVIGKQIDVNNLARWKKLFEKPLNKWKPIQ